MNPISKCGCEVTPDEVVELDYSTLYWCPRCGSRWWTGRNAWTVQTPTMYEEHSEGIKAGLLKRKDILYRVVTVREFNGKPLTHVRWFASELRAMEYANESKAKGFEVQSVTQYRQERETEQ